MSSEETNKQNMSQHHLMTSVNVLIYQGIYRRVTISQSSSTIMDLLNEYEFESLPYIDEEYNDPLVREQVHKLISQEMLTFQPNPEQYLEHIPYPNLKFSNSSAFRSEYERIINLRDEKSVQLPERIDTKRYNVECPKDGPLQKDVQAWRKAVSNAKSQFENEQIKSLNLDTSKNSVNKQWLTYNKQLESTEKTLIELVNTKKRKISEINVVRKVAQEKASYELNRLTTRRNNAINKQHQILTAIDKLLSNYPTDKANKFLLECALESREVSEVTFI